MTTKYDPECNIVSCKNESELFIVMMNGDGSNFYNKEIKIIGTCLDHKENFQELTMIASAIPSIQLFESKDELMVFLMLEE